MYTFKDTQGLAEFKHLLKNTENPRQLFVYLKDAYFETFRPFQRKTSSSSIYKSGHFFNRAFGLDLSYDGLYDLGMFIARGNFLPRGLYAKDMERIHYDECIARMELYWNNI